MQYLEYWKYGAVGLVVLFMVGKFLWSKVSVSKIFTKKEVVVDIESLESQDQKAMAHLRNRAIVFGNEDLIKDIKAVHAKFYDIHCQAVKGNK